jgi:amino acid transporter
MLTGREPGPTARSSDAHLDISTYRGQERALHADRLGGPGLLLSILAATAPLLVVAGVMPTTWAVMGIVGLPLLFVLLAVVLVLFSVGYAEMSRHVHNAGAFYAYIARGLGGTAGAGASFVALVSYSLMQVGGFGLFGFQASALLKQHAHITVSWWVSALCGLVLIGFMGALKISFNAKVIGLLLLLECCLVVVSDVSFLTDPGPQGVSMHAFNPHTLSGAGLGTAMSFAVAAFTGFEMAPVYSEETSKPQRVVAKVMFAAVSFAGLFYAFSSWALSVATGPSHIVGSAQKFGPGLLFVLAEGKLGHTFSDLLSVIFLTGIFACQLSFHNVVARYAFAMGREGLLPRALGRASRTSGAPMVGSLMQSGIAFVGVVGFAISGRDPIASLFTWLGDVGALGITLLMACTCVAIIVFFVKRGVAAAQGWRLLCSSLAFLCLITISVYTVKDFAKILGADPGSPLRWVLPGLILVAAVFGLCYGSLLRTRRPQTHARIGLGNEAFQLDIAADGAEAQKARTA